ncbi:biliverdin-producing heme oxygenase [Streptomyces sp. NPDC019531]|uniref:biliverdin-producing heme oxygenase n=1 Tax=Streptomyces sp. NPDC019531 TaxID=3365062 RepID=UPI00384B640C
MTPTAAERLRSATRAWHDILQTSDFALALLAGRLPLDRYVGQLTAYRVILAALETELTRTTCPDVVRVWSPDLIKVPLIDGDLRYFGEGGAGAGSLAADAAGAFADDIRRTAVAAPRELLGFLYVLEGSTLGALFLRPHLLAAHRLGDTDGTTYYASGDPSRWARLTALLNETLTDPEPLNRVIAAAERAYRHTAAVTEALSRGLAQDGS